MWEEDPTHQKAQTFTILGGIGLIILLSAAIFYFAGDWASFRTALGASLAFVLALIIFPVVAWIFIRTISAVIRAFKRTKKG